MATIPSLGTSPTPTTGGRQPRPILQPELLQNSMSPASSTKAPTVAAVAAALQGLNTSGLSDGDYGDITISGGATIFSIKGTVLTWSNIGNKPTFGTASALNAAASGNAAAGEVVKGNDTRLSDARTPTSHTHEAASITGLADVAVSGAYADLSGRPTLGTAASRDAPAIGDASSSQVVLGNDSRLAYTPPTNAEWQFGVEGTIKLWSPATLVSTIRWHSVQHWGNAANQAAMVALNQATQWDTVRRTDTGTDWRLTGADPAVAGNWTNLGGGSGSLTVEAVSSSRTITAADDGKILQCSAGITLTLPAGLSPRPRFGVEFDSGTITIAVSGGATANGGTSSVTRSITYNPAGFAVIPRAGSDGYGVSGA